MNEEDRELWRLAGEAGLWAERIGGRLCSMGEARAALRTLSEQMVRLTEWAGTDDDVPRVDDNTALVQRARRFVVAHLSDSDYGRPALASDMCMCDSALYKKMRRATGRSVSSFIARVRLEEAIRLARSHPDWQLLQLSVCVGFNSPKYFSELFKKEFGMLLRQYLAQEK